MSDVKELPFTAIALEDYLPKDETEIDLKVNNAYEVIEVKDGLWLVKSPETGASGWVSSDLLKKKEIEKTSVDESIDALKEFEKAQLCGICDKEVKDSFVLANEKRFHLECFLCISCSTELAGKEYVERDEQYYCAECFKKNFSPKCSYCSEIITGEYIVALDKTWHSDCFCCTSCGNSFESDQFKNRDNKQYCEKCYRNLFIVNCFNCSKRIEEKVLNAADKSFHPECFVCSVDQVVIDEKDSFHFHEDKIYCVDHYKQLFVHTCARCNKDISSKFVKVLDFHFHDECWTCELCDKSLYEVGFTRKDEKFICKTHVDEMKKEVNNENGKVVDKEEETPKEQPKENNNQQLEKQTSFSNVKVSVGEDKSLMKVEEEANSESIQKHYPYTQLIDIDKLPKNVNIKKREDFLSDKEFEEVFKMPRSEFEKLKLWKQKMLKKAVKLF